MSANKKIALIVPALRSHRSPGGGREPWFEPMPPLWALALATYLRAALPSVRVDILDEQILGRAALLKKLSSSRYDLAGFSPVAYTYGDSLRYARLLKKRGALVVMGGHYAPALAGEIFALRGPASADHCVDAIVRYDGERALYELARGTAFKDIKNLVYAGPGGLPAENPVENLDLAALPPVDYSLVDVGAYFRLQSARSRGILPFVSQRGCKWAEGPGRCFFCSIQSFGGLRAIPPAAAAARMRALAGRTGAGCIFEGSDDFPADAAWLKEFSAAAARGKFPDLRVFARATTLNRNSVALLKAAGTRYVSVGAEAMSDTVLRAARKGASAAQNSRAVALLLAAGIMPKLHIVLGLPGETRATFSEAFSNFKKMELPAESPERVLLASTFAVYPGTEAWRRLLALEPRYRGKDILDEGEMFRDWLKHFSGLDEADVEAARCALEKLFAARVRLSPRAGGAAGPRRA
ncbi:MAG TPA: radical SAM protein [Elusimicrobiales bacterium]|nr:radical SAM protein [Elusimicrobiales bacterium]